MVMKKLSPTEPLVSFVITIESPPDTPITKVEKIARTKYSMKTGFVAPYTIEIKTSSLFKEYTTMLNRVREILHIIPNNSSVCIEYWVLAKQYPCPCTDSSKYKEYRKMCIKNLLNKTLYIYCNERENYVSIRVFKTKPVSEPDPLIVTKTAFLHCGTPKNVLENISSIEQDIKLIKHAINKMFSSDDRPIPRPQG
ncbi:MAG: hypothetical protein DRO13_00710 [Thermoprotei archaeon]|nr:MAG: hypothetical protein DRO13_00710 [Thermoprotei archaeon]